MTRRILTDFVIDKIAAVDRPCQEHATVTIMKRAPSAFDDGPILKTAGSIQRAVSAFGSSPNKLIAKAHIVACAKAIGAEGELPEGWLKKFELSSLTDRLAKDFFAMFPVAASVSPVEDEDDTEDFDEAFDAIIVERSEWMAQDLLDPYFDALRRSLRSICGDSTVFGSDRLLAIRNSVGQFLDAVQAKFPALPEEVGATMDAANTGATLALKSLAMLKAGVLKAKTNEMLESLKGKGTGVMPHRGPASRSSQPINRQDSGQNGKRL